MLEAACERDPVTERRRQGGREGGRESVCVCERERERERERVKEV